VEDEKGDGSRGEEYGGRDGEGRVGGGGGGGWRVGGGEEERRGGEGRDGGTRGGVKEKVKMATGQRRKKGGGKAMGKHEYEEREENKVVSIICIAQDRVNPRGLRKR